MMTGAHLVQVSDFCQQMHRLGVSEADVARILRRYSHLSEDALVTTLATVLQQARDQAAV